MMTDEQTTARKLSAILSADVEGYSLLMADDEAGTVEKLKAYRESMNVLIQSHSGRVVDAVGDNLLAEFSSAVEAVECAVEMQADLKEKNDILPEDRRLEFRIGINIGDVIQDGDRIYGGGVNVAARIEGLAEPGGICISRNAYDHIKDKLKLGYDYLGQHEVKNIKDPVRVYKVLMAPGDEGKLIGEKPEPSGKRWSTLAVATIAILIGIIVWQFNYEKPTPIEVASVENMAFPLPEKPSIAVLPFDNMSGDPNQEYLSDGMAEEIITALSKLPYLFVIARNSTFSYKGKPVKIGRVAEELGVQYVLEGSVRRDSDRVRVTAQLIDAIKGHHLWAERYERELKDTFALQDEITGNILSALAVKLTKGEQATIRREDTDNLEAHLKILQAIWYLRRDTKEGHMMARKLGEEAMAIDPEYARPYALLAGWHVRDVFFGWSKSRKESLANALKLAQKAISLDDAYPGGYWALSSIYMFKRQYQRARAEAERAITLDPNRADAYSQLGAVLWMEGRPQEAIAPLEMAIRINPIAPSIYYRRLGGAYRDLGRYEEAIVQLKKAVNLTPDSLYAHVGLAATYSLAGRNEEAHYEVSEILRIQPKFSLDSVAKRSPFKHKADIDRVAGALRKAGLPEHPPRPLPDKPSIAVLPFDNMSDDPKQEYFSDGITDDLITDLSKISGLLVIARNSTFAYKKKPVKVQQVARDLGVRYVLEGSVRKAADQVRINAQLIDSSTGGHLWAERYDGRMGNIFALQDKITGQIVNALAVQLTADEEKRFEIKETSSMEAYDAFLQGWQNYLHRTPEDFVKALSYFKKAIALDPNYGRAYAALALTCWRGAGIGWARKMGMSYPEARVRARHYLELALKNPTPTAHRVAAEMAFNRRHKQKALAEAKRALALDPNNSENHRMMGKVMMALGKPEDCIASNKRAMLLNPRDKAFPLGSIGIAHFAKGQYEEAVTFSEQALENNPKANSLAATLAAAYGQLGRETEARAALERYIKSWGRIKPGLPTVMYAFPLDTEHADRFAEGLLKAGLPGKPGGYYKISDNLRLTGEEIKSVFLGRKASGIWGKSQWVINRPNDGDAIYWWGPKVIGNGKSWVEGDVLCDQWRDRYGGLSYCGDIYRNPQGTPQEKNEYVIIDDRGIWGCSLED